MARDHTSYSLYPREAESLRALLAYLTLSKDGIHALAWRDARLSTMFLFLHMDCHIPAVPVNNRDKTGGVAMGINLPAQATRTAHTVWEQREDKFRPLFGTISGMVAYSVCYFGRGTMKLKLSPHIYDPIDNNPLYVSALRQYQGTP